MTANITFNPILTTTAAGMFTTYTDGDVQGTYFDDPAVRFALRGGLVSTSETYPMWGGILISELVPTPNSASAPDESLGPIISRATVAWGTTGLVPYGTAGGATGFTVF